MDGKFAVSFGAEGGGGETRGRARAFGEEGGVGCKDPAEGSDVGSSATICGKDKVAGAELSNPIVSQYRRVLEELAFPDGKGTEIRRPGGGWGGMSWRVERSEGGDIQIEAEVAWERGYGYRPMGIMGDGCRMVGITEALPAKAVRPGRVAVKGEDFVVIERMIDGGVNRVIVVRPGLVVKKGGAVPVSERNGEEQSLGADGVFGTFVEIEPGEDAAPDAP